MTPLLRLNEDDARFLTSMHVAVKNEELVADSSDRELKRRNLRGCSLCACRAAHIDRLGQRLFRLRIWSAFQWTVIFGLVLLLLRSR